MEPLSIRVRLWLYVLLAAGLVCLFALEVSRSKGMDRLRAENSALCAQMADLAAARDRIAELEQDRHELLRALDSPPPELLALRDEVAGLRAETNQVAALRLNWQQSFARARKLEDRIIALQSELAAKPAVPRFGAWVGVSVRNVEQGGAQIMAVVDQSPAARADLQRGDRILAVDGQAIVGAEDFKHLMSQKTGGQTLAFDIARQDALLTVNVQPRDWPQ